MPTPDDVAYGRALLERHAIAPDVLRAVYQQLPPGRGLLEELVARGLVTPAQAQWLVAQRRQVHAPAP
ncbi:MAG: hypothetical protein D6731_25905, partial [Planctomycetota bacterium]